VAQGIVRSFDDYFVDFETSTGLKVSVPWREVGAIEEKEASGASAFFGAKMVEGDAKVESLLAPLSPSRARGLAFGTGFLIHGWGHRYARDNKTFLSLVGAEAFGLLVAAIGGNDFLDPNFKNEDQTISTAMLITGGAFFVGSWLWDIAYAPEAARKFNKAKGLALLDREGKVMLGMNLEF
jgi:hypothetical protein